MGAHTAHHNRGGSVSCGSVARRFRFRLQQVAPLTITGKFTTSYVIANCLGQVLLDVYVGLWAELFFLLRFRTSAKIDLEFRPQLKMMATYRE